jgi:hypothetical protein
VLGSFLPALAGCEGCDFMPGDAPVDVSVQLAAQSASPVALRVALCPSGAAPSSCEDMTSGVADAGGSFPQTFYGGVTARADGLGCTFGSWDLEATAENCAPATVHLDDGFFNAPAPLILTLACR